jgi:RimJ/RimL family protein N-acetyltransferase
LKLHLGADAFVAQWVAEHIPHMRGGAFGPCVGMAVLSERGEMMGGVVFHNFDPHVRSIEVSGASVSPRWLTRPLISLILSYPFEQLKCRRITTITPRRNEAARRFNRKLGYKQEGLVRRGFGNDDAIIYGMLAGEWRRGRYCLATQEERAI